jgi:Ca2+-binding RTX toxin-like protein
MISLSFKAIVLLAVLSTTIIFIPQNHNQIFAKKVIGFQTDETLVDGVHNLIRCLGNLLLPSAICKGTNHADKIDAGDVGFQTIYGLDGNDLIQGDAQADTIFGGGGNDVISGGEGTDTLFGNDGDDIIYGDSGSNVVFGGGGNFIYGNSGDDRLYGGSDNDVLIGGPGHDFFDCNEGADTVADFDPKEDTANNNCEVLK